MVEAPGGLVRIAANQYAWRTGLIGQIVGGRQFKVVYQSPEPLPPEPFPRTRSRARWEEFLREQYRTWGGRWELHR
jgi:urea transport system substrate-binding protein